jgi:hypothetical protein
MIGRRPPRPGEIFCSTKVQKCDGRIISVIALSRKEKLPIITANNKFECIQIRQSLGHQSLIIFSLSFEASEIIFE